MNLLEKALEYTRQELTKKYRGKAVSEEEILDDIHDCMEQFGQDNDLPEGWWMSYGDIHDIFVLLQEHVKNMLVTQQQKPTFRSIIAIAGNWRIIVLTILAAATLAFAAGDCDNLVLFFVTKVIAVILGFATHKLSKRWDGKMPELEVFSIDEDKED
jgi:hypothetical protein